MLKNDAFIDLNGRDGTQEDVNRIFGESAQGPADMATRASELLDDIARIQETVNAQAEAVAAISHAVATRALEATDDSETENSEDYSSHASEDTDGDLQETVMQLTREIQPTAPTQLAVQSSNGKSVFSVAKFGDW